MWVNTLLFEGDSRLILLSFVYKLVKKKWARGDLNPGPLVVLVHSGCCLECRHIRPAL